MFGARPYLSRARADIAVDECEASSRSAGKSRVEKGASTSDQEANEQGYEDDELSDEDETDCFLRALLDPNEHAQRLLEVRTRVAELCRVSDVLAGTHIPMKDTLRSVVASFGLLRDAGIMQDSLILLADDPTRWTVVQTVEIDVNEIVILESDLRPQPLGLLPETELHDRMYQAAQNLLGLLGMTHIHADTLDLRDPERDEQIKLFGVILALATSSYAGSHCRSLCERLPELEPESEGALMDIGHELSLRSCRFACLDKFIGGPVWVFGAGILQKDMLLAITTEQFDDLWGPVTGLVEPYSSNAHEHTRTIALQTEGGVLSKMEARRGSLSTHENEIPTHWTPVQHGSRSLPGVPFDSSFHLKATLLIGFGELTEHPACHKTPANATKCFNTNRDCKFDAKAYESSMEARSFEYIGTSTRQWVIDTKAVNIAAGWSGPSIGTTRTWKLRPATSWKAAMLQYCSQPGRAIKPIMRLRVGLARSICTGNARRVSLFEALKLAFPQEQETIKDLVRSAKTDQSSR